MLGRLVLVFYILNILHFICCDIYDEYEYSDGYHGNSYGDYAEEPPPFGPGSDSGRVRRFGEPPRQSTRNYDDIRGALQKIMPDHTELFQDVSKPQVLTETPFINYNASVVGPPFQTDLTNDVPSQPYAYEEMTSETGLQNFDISETEVKSISGLTPEVTVSTAELSTQQSNYEDTSMTDVRMLFTYEMASTTSAFQRSLTLDPTDSAQDNTSYVITTFYTTERSTFLPSRSMTQAPEKLTVTSRKPVRTTVRAPKRTKTRMALVTRSKVTSRVVSVKVTSRVSRAKVTSSVINVKSSTPLFRASSQDVSSNSDGMIKKISPKYAVKMDSDIYEEVSVPLLYDNSTYVPDTNILRQGPGEPNLNLTIYSTDTTPSDSNSTESSNSTTTVFSNSTTVESANSIEAGNIATVTNATTKLTTTTNKYLVFDIESFLAILANLTYDYDTNLTDVMNITLRNNTPTCPVRFVTTTPATATIEPYYEEPKDLNNTVVAKCFVCGLKSTGIPYDADCADAFAGDFLPLTPVNPIAKSKTSSYRKYCRYGEIYNYHENETRPRSLYGRWTGGCSVRWTDLTGLYTQRTCRNRKRAITGLHFASKRMAKLEMSLVHTEQGCIISPVATLLPLSRGVSLFARFHVCVCMGNWCNGATHDFPTIAYALGVMVVWLCGIATYGL